MIKKTKTMENYKIKTKGHNQEIWDKMGRLGYRQDEQHIFKSSFFIALNKYGEWSKYLGLGSFNSDSYPQISWKKFLKLPETNPFEGKEYYVMLDNKKDIDYLLRIAIARGYKRESFGKLSLNDGWYMYSQFVFWSDEFGSNSTECNNMGTKLTLSQFINGEWPEDRIEWNDVIGELISLREQRMRIIEMESTPSAPYPFNYEEMKKCEQICANYERQGVGMSITIKLAP